MFKLRYTGKAVVYRTITTQTKSKTRFSNHTVCAKPWWWSQQIQDIFFTKLVWWSLGLQHFWATWVTRIGTSRQHRLSWHNEHVKTSTSRRSKAITIWVQAESPLGLQLSKLNWWIAEIFDRIINDQNTQKPNGVYCGGESLTPSERLCKHTQKNSRACFFIPGRRQNKTQWTNSHLPPLKSTHFCTYWAKMKTQKPSSSLTNLWEVQGDYTHSKLFMAQFYTMHPTSYNCDK